MWKRISESSAPVAAPVTISGANPNQGGEGPGMDITHGNAGSPYTVEPVPVVRYSPVCGHSTHNPLCEHCSKG